MCCLLLGCSLEPRSNSCALGTVGSVKTIGLSINGCLHLKNQSDERRQDWLIQKLRLRQIHKLYTIKADQPPFLSSTNKKTKAGSDCWNTKLLGSAWKGGSDGLVLKKTILVLQIRQTSQRSLFGLVVYYLRWGPGPGLPFCWGVIFRLGSITWGAILIISWK